MNSALAAFVEGKTKSGDWWHRDMRDAAAKQVTAMPPRELRIQEVNDRIPTLDQTANVRAEETSSAGHYDSSHQQAIINDNGEPSTEPPPNPPMATGDYSPSEVEGALQPKPKPREAFASSTNTSSPVPWQTKEVHHGSDLANMIRATAARAASLIQRGVGADGVLFLDATVGSAGSLIDSAQKLSTTETETEGTKPSGFDTHEAQSHQSHERETATSNQTLDSAKSSVILGSAYSEGIEERVRSAIQQARFSEKVLKSLLRRYRNGVRELRVQPNLTVWVQTPYLALSGGRAARTLDPDLEPM